jgi:two-component system chemotaxis response regulator CheV
MGFSVMEAGDGQEGLDKLDDLYKMFGEDLPNQLKIIISDVEMPKMDGFHFAANAKEDGRFDKIPIVFNSSISDHFSEIRGKEAGGEGYLVKFEASTFYDEVARVVRAHMK